MKQVAHSQRRGKRGAPTVRDILAGVGEGARISAADALVLYEEADLLLLGEAARAAAKRIHGEKPVTFLIDRNINYTNICTSRCRFCAFYREEGSSDAYLLPAEEVEEKVEDAVAQGATQIMLQGGLHPSLALDYILGLIKAVKRRFTVHLHSFSPPEIHHFSVRSGLSLEETLRLLRDTGLDSLPGGGAEILADSVRRRVSPRKITAEVWLEVMEKAHRLALPTTATMVFGLGEHFRERLLHLDRIRTLQDRTGGFRSFIPWTFQPGNTALGKGGASGLEYLRTLSLSRLYLDNIAHIQGSWVTQGREIGQLSLDFGADDLGSIMLEENVVRSAGTSHRLKLDEMVDLIHGARRTCAQRDTLFHVLKVFDS